MIELDNFKSTLNELAKPLSEVKGALNLDVKKNRISEIDLAMQEPTFWNDVDKANKLARESKILKSEVSDFERLNQTYEDIETLIEMGYETNDESLVKEIESEIKLFKDELEEIHTKLLFSGEYDAENAVVSIFAGSGGTESCDWASILYRMYTRFAERKGFKCTVIDFEEGDVVGIKTVVFRIEGEYAYGFMRSENGVHRLVRMSPYNAQGKRETSFVRCEVMPDLKEDLDIEIKDDEYEMTAYRSSGAGGQHINKTSSAVRIVHKATGIVVNCQEERSQFQNKEKALQMLKTKLYMLKKQQADAKWSDIRGEVKENGWGSQIRSYFLQPYRLVKDLRTGEETSNSTAVLDGDIDRFISAYLKWQQLGCPDRKAVDAE